jgi:lipopolysaccharide export system protein LptC
MNGVPPGPARGPGRVETTTPDRIARHLATGRRTSFTALPLERETPNAGRIARRRQVVQLSKWLMPIGAVALLGSVALWPELDRSTRIGRAAFEDARSLRASSGDMTDARYHGLDTHGRPYTITALSARQIGPDRVDLVQPQADLLDGRAWLMVTADHGVYAPHDHLLDLSGHVVLYRNDGTMMTGPTSTIDLHESVDQSNDWVHVEGPMGVLDAQHYLMASHEGVAQFGGPARLVINGGHGS